MCREAGHAMHKSDMRTLQTNVKPLNVTIKASKIVLGSPFAFFAWGSSAPSGAFRSVEGESIPGSPPRKPKAHDRSFYPSLYMYTHCTRCTRDEHTTP